VGVVVPESLQFRQAEVAQGKRARDPHAKDARRTAILRAAGELLDEVGLADLSMAHIAQRAGLAKGTLYLYFRTKEELFLHLLLSRLGDWFETFGTALDAAPGPVAPAEVGRIVAATIAPGSSLTRLLTLVFTALEADVQTAEAAVFLQRLFELASGAGEQLERRVTGFPHGQGVRFFRFLRALVVGLSRAVSLPAPVREVMADERLAPFRVDFGSELSAGVTALLRGMVEEARAAPG